MRRALAILVLLTSPAAAAELTTADGGTAREVDFECDVVLDGLVARVTTRQELRGSSDGVEAIYRFELPRDAAIVGFAITPPGGKAQRGAAIEAEAAITPAVGRETSSLVPDLGLVRWLGDDGAATFYELIVYPLAEEASTIVELSWVAPMGYADGRLALRIPARGGELGAITGTVKATPPSGVKKLRDLRVGGAVVAAKPGKDTWPFVADDDVSFDVTPVLTKPVFSFATAAVGDDGGAVAVSLLRPRPDAVKLDFERVLFVLDLSASNASPEARDAMSAIVGGVLDDLPDTTVQAFTFDHDVRKALPGFRRASDDSRAALFAAIQDAPGAPGSDLRRAVEEASVAIDRASTLVVIVTDGILPTDADATSLDEAFGLSVMVSAVLIAPDDQPLPDPRGTALAEFTAANGGRVIALHPSEAEARAPKIAAELAADDWTIEVDAGGAVLFLDVPEDVAPGGGVVAFGWYRGKAPEELSFENDGETLTAKKVKLSRIGALALVGAVVEDDVWEQEESTGISRGRTLGVVTSLTSLVAVDGTDDVAAARLALGVKGGTFARVPPPGEGQVPEPWVAIEAARDVSSRYELDIAGRIRADVIGPQLLPAARACFDAERVRGGSPTGTIKLEIEIARGEVIAARAMSASVPEMVRCLREAAFALTIPSYTLDDPDAIYQIRYPLEFITKGDKPGVNAVDDATGMEIDLGDSVDQPLGDLTQQD